MWEVFLNFAIFLGLLSLVYYVAKVVYKPNQAPELDTAVEFAQEPLVAADLPEQEI